MCADRAATEVSAGEYSAGEYSAGEYSAGLSATGQDSACLSAPGQLIDAEDCHLLVGNTYPVKSQLVSSQLVNGYSKPKIKRKRGVWICEGDGLSVAGGDVQKVYRGWCDWVLARGQSLSL